MTTAGTSGVFDVPCTRATLDPSGRRLSRAIENIILMPAVCTARQQTVIAIVNLAWPREAVYGADHWYVQYGAFTFIGFFVITGGAYYYFVQRDKPAEPLPEHRAEIDAALAQT